MCPTWDVFSLLTGFAQLTATESILGLRHPHGHLAKHAGQRRGCAAHTLPPQLASTEMLLSHDGSSRTRRKCGKVGPWEWNDSSEQPGAKPKWPAATRRSWPPGAQSRPPASACPAAGSLVPEPHLPPHQLLIYAHPQSVPPSTPVLRSAFGEETTINSR